MARVVWWQSVWLVLAALQFSKRECINAVVILPGRFTLHALAVQTDAVKQVP